MFGENVTIIKKFKNFSLCKCELDDYVGYIQNNVLGLLPSPTNIIIVPFALIYKEPNEKSMTMMKVFLNSRISRKNVEGKWVECFVNNENETGFILKDNLNLRENVKINWMRLAKNYINVPYLWGGKTFFGIDCSGLVQLCLNAIDINIPRNTNDQLTFKSKFLKDVKKIEKGCLIFWEGHVAIALTNTEIIHSNAYTMSVKVEKLEKVLERLNMNNLKIIGIKKVLS